MMKTYIGTKVVHATPMTRLDYNVLRGWAVPADEDGADEGYLVEYRNGSKPNHKDYEGYISWSPKQQFEEAYFEATSLPFGAALEAIQRGYRAYRTGWNGAGMWIAYSPGVEVCPAQNFWSEQNRLYAEQNGGAAEVRPYITMKTADGSIVAWVASQTDLLAHDWHVET